MTPYNFSTILQWWWHPWKNHSSLSLLHPGVLSFLCQTTLILLQLFPSWASPSHRWWDASLTPEKIFFVLPMLNIQADISHRVDDSSGSIGKRYARTDEVADAASFSVSEHMSFINLPISGVYLCCLGGRPVRHHCRLWLLESPPLRDSQGKGLNHPD